LTRHTVAHIIGAMRSKRILLAHFARWWRSASVLMPSPGQAARLLVAVGMCPVGLTACGRSIPDGTVVVHVDKHAITKATVDHWISVIERGGGFTGSRGESVGTPKQRALALLITSDWLIDEAADRGIPLSADIVDKALRRREHENSEFRDETRETGQTIADVKFELKSELAAELLRKKLTRRSAHITSREIADFYRRNRSLFGTGARVTDLIEGQPSAAAASVAASVPSSWTEERFGGKVIRERVTRRLEGSAEKTKVVDAIFAARPGIISPPVLLNRSWAVFVVRKVIIGKPVPFAKARAEVLGRLNERRQQAIATWFDSQFRSRWKARTRCRTDYVGPGCPQFARPLGAYEDPFSTRAHLLLSEPLAHE
jgi:parvulin-like peptidyl-prolyl cis-trans isomerase-like protein